MRVDVEPGTYVVAVSGGVDSVVLLHLLTQLQAETKDSKNKYRFIVAHFDHGIRDESAADRRLVADLAKQYGLPFVFQEGNLGKGTSEEAARRARYDFLKSVQKAAKAKAIITAHHQDDVIETAIINILRGTGRKGLSSLTSRPELVRPLINEQKNVLRRYAAEQGLVWHEDSTNDDLTLLRNYVRKVLVPQLGRTGRQALLDIIDQAKATNAQLDEHILSYLHIQPSWQTLDRHSFVLLPHDVAREVTAQWLRAHLVQFDTPLIERVVIAGKTFAPGKQFDLNPTYKLLFGNETIALVAR